MKFDIIFINLALVAVVLIPFILFLLYGRSEKRRLKKLFSQEAYKHQLRVTEKDSWNNTTIGLDPDRAVILFMQLRKNGPFTEIIDLKQVKSCEVLPEIRTVANHQRPENVLQRIDLKLTLYNKVTRFITLYDSDENYNQEYEQKFAEKWGGVINSFKASQPVSNSAA